MTTLALVWLALVAAGVVGFFLGRAWGPPRPATLDLGALARSVTFACPKSWLGAGGKVHACSKDEDHSGHHRCACGEEWQGVERTAPS